MAGQSAVQSVNRHAGEASTAATHSARSVKSAIFSTIAAFEQLLRSAARAPLSDITNFLLLQYPGALGTAVHATPMIPALRAASPHCKIAVAAKGVALDVFRNNPGVDWLIETPSPLSDLSGAIRSLRNRNPFGHDPFIALTTLGNERTRVGIAALMSGAAARFGFTEVPELYRVALHFDPSQSQIDNNLRILESLGYLTRHTEPQIFFSELDLAWARAALAENGVRDGQMAAVFVTQTSITQRKSWPAERFRAAARHMIDRYGAHIFFVGTAAESAPIDALCAGISGTITSLAGKTTLLQLSALLSLCRVGLTLDTGTLHLGRAVGLPMVIIAPAWSPPIEWLPVDNPRYRILKNADLSTCPPDYVIDEVSTGDVTAALDDLVAAFPERAALTSSVQNKTGDQA